MFVSNCLHMRHQGLLRGRAATFAATFVLTAILALVGSAQVASADPGNPPTTSRYIKNINIDWFIAEGLYATRERATGGLILDFGSPAKLWNNSLREKNW